MYLNIVIEVQSLINANSNIVAYKKRLKYWDMVSVII